MLINSKNIEFETFIKDFKESEDLMPELQNIFNPKKWNLNDTKKHWLKIANEQLKSIGKTFIVDDNNRALILHLFNYFWNIDTTKEKVHGFDKFKNIMLSGNFGCGKTLIMEIFSEHLINLRADSKFILKSMENIYIDFQNDYAFAINEYGLNKIKNEYGVLVEKPYNLCIDDIGTTNLTIKVYGNELNFLEQLMLIRYELWTKKGIKTHITSNLTKEQLSKNFTDRMKSRILEMYQTKKILSINRRTSK